MNNYHHNEQKDLRPTANPFESLEHRLHRIESLLTQSLQTPAKETPQASDQFIPVKDLFNSKYCSKPTFYSHVRSGLVTLYKLGGRSYVKSDEFYSAFRKVNISSNQNTRLANPKN